MKISLDIVASVARRARVSQNQEVGDPGRTPLEGDIVLGRVKALGRHPVLETCAGIELPLAIGQTCAVTLGRRYSTLEFCGFVPDLLAPGDGFDLLNIGGVAGKIDPLLSHDRSPTLLTYLGAALGPDGRPLSTLDNRLLDEFEGPAPFNILVVGSDMDVGKSTSAAVAARILAEEGIPVGGAKITGTSRMKDLERWRKAGASSVADFLDAGYPSTDRRTQEELESIFDVLTGHLASQGARVVVIESADGVFQRETGLILASSHVRERTNLLVGCAPDAVAAWGMIEYLKGTFGIAPDFLGGLITSRPLAMKEFDGKSTTPFLDASLASRDRLLARISRVGA